MNIYIEKMYIIVAIWSLLLFFLTLFKAFQNIFLLCCCGKNFILKHLNQTQDDDDSIKKKNNQTYHNKLEYMRPDEVLVLRLIKANASDYDLSLVIRELSKMNWSLRTKWNYYRSINGKSFRQELQIQMEQNFKWNKQIYKNNNDYNNLLLILYL